MERRERVQSSNTIQCLWCEIYVAWNFYTQKVMADDASWLINIDINFKNICDMLTLNVNDSNVSVCAPTILTLERDTHYLAVEVMCSWLGFSELWCSKSLHPMDVSLQMTFAENGPVWDPHWPLSWGLQIRIWLSEAQLKIDQSLNSEVALQRPTKQECRSALI